MKNFKLFLTIAALFMIGVISSDRAAAQNQTLPPQNSDAPLTKPAKRPNLMQLLDLSPEQLKQLRAVNTETRDAMRDAAQKQRAARLALDAAIYSDAATLADVEQKTRDLTDAQTAVTKQRADLEFRIRQILTPEQLIKFRELRAQSAAKRGERFQNLRRRFPQRRPQ